MARLQLKKFNDLKLMFHGVHQEQLPGCFAVLNYMTQKGVSTNEQGDEVLAQAWGLFKKAQKPFDKTKGGINGINELIDCGFISQAEVEKFDVIIEKVLRSGSTETQVSRTGSSRNSASNSGPVAGDTQPSSNTTVATPVQPQSNRPHGLLHKSNYRDLAKIVGEDGANLLEGFLVEARVNKQAADTFVSALLNAKPEILVMDGVTGSVFSRTGIFVSEEYRPEGKEVRILSDFVLKYVKSNLRENFFALIYKAVPTMEPPKDATPLAERRSEMESRQRFFQGAHRGDEPNALQESIRQSTQQSAFERRRSDSSRASRQGAPPPKKEEPRGPGFFSRLFKWLGTKLLEAFVLIVGLLILIVTEPVKFVFRWIFNEAQSPLEKIPGGIYILAIYDSIVLGGAPGKLVRTMYLAAIAVLIVVALAGLFGTAKFTLDRARNNTYKGTTNLVVPTQEYEMVPTVQPTIITYPEAQPLSADTLYFIGASDLNEAYCNEYQVFVATNTDSQMSFSVWVQLRYIGQPEDLFNQVTEMALSVQSPCE